MFMACVPKTTQSCLIKKFDWLFSPLQLQSYPILCFHVKYKLGSSSLFAGEQAGGRPSDIHARIRVLPCRISVIVVKYVVCICAPLIKQGCIERNIKPEKDNSFTAPSGPSEFTKSTSLINIQAFYFCFAQVIS